MNGRIIFGAQKQQLAVNTMPSYLARFPRCYLCSSNRSLSGVVAGCRCATPCFPQIREPIVFTNVLKIDFPEQHFLRAPRLIIDGKKCVFNHIKPCPRCLSLSSCPPSGRIPPPPPPLSPNKGDTTFCTTCAFAAAPNASTGHSSLP